MKQKFFLATMAAIAMTSCSNDEIMEINTGKAISFRTAMATRATETTYGDLNEFFVTAFTANSTDTPYFTDLKFERDGNRFFSGEKYYYPGDGSDLTFYAYAPSQTELGATIDNKTQIMTGFSPKTDISQQVDFITAKATGNMENTAAGVELQFAHRLAQIEIQASSANTSYKFEIKGIRIGMPVSKGDFNFTNNTWTLGTDKAVYEKTFDTATELETTASALMAGDNAMLIPQQLTAWDQENDKTNTSKGAYISVLVRITTKAGALVYPFKGDTEKYAWAAIPVSTNWEAGKKYVYTLNFTTGAGYVDPTATSHAGEPILNGEITFEIDIEEWTKDDNNNDVDMPLGDLEVVTLPDENENVDPWED